MTRIDRRRFLHSLGGSVAIAAAAPTLWLPRSALAGTSVKSIKRGRGGTTIELGLDSAPFPAPGSPYRDDTTWVFVPHHFRTPAEGKVDAIVHFHGHRTTAWDAMRRQQLREQLLESKQNTILIVPQGPVEANDSAAGKLEERGGFENFLGGVRRALQLGEIETALRDAAIGAGARIGTVAVSAHSGGFHIAAMSLKHGGFNVTEVYLFDALYGDRRFFRDWVLDRRRETDLRERHKLVCYYAGGQTEQQADELMDEFDQRGLHYLHERREGELTRADLTRGRAIFINTKNEHGKVTHKSNALRDCLFASCFKRRLGSDWFEDKNEKRKIDSRG